MISGPEMPRTRTRLTPTCCHYPSSLCLIPFSGLLRPLGFPVRYISFLFYFYFIFFSLSIIILHGSSPIFFFFSPSFFSPPFLDLMRSPTSPWRRRPARTSRLNQQSLFNRVFSPILCLFLYKQSTLASYSTNCTRETIAGIILSPFRIFL